MASSGRLKLIVFDFDQTLSMFHVFKTLSGWGDRGKENGFRIPKPFATSEGGQMRRIEELSHGEFKGKGGFACAAFGGSERVAELREHLRGLHSQDVELVICTKGLVGPVQKCLSDLDLLPFFAEIYGNVGDNYGNTAYDVKVAGMECTPELFNLLGDSHQANWQSKDKLVARLRADKSLSKEEVVLVEDDPEEINRARFVCRTLFVKDGRGVTSAHFATLQQMLEGSDAQSVKSRSIGGGRFPCAVM